MSIVSPSKSNVQLLNQPALGSQRSIRRMRPVCINPNRNLAQLSVAKLSLVELFRDQPVG